MDDLNWNLSVVNFGRDGTSYTFTNCSQEGRFGPEQSQCEETYEGTTLEGVVNVNDGIQKWIVSQTGSYTIEVWGAQGGDVGGRSGE